MSNERASFPGEDAGSGQRRPPGRIESKGVAIMASSKDRSAARKSRRYQLFSDGQPLENRNLMAVVSVIQKPNARSQYPIASNSNPNSRNFLRLGNGLNAVHIRSRNIVATSAAGGMGTLIQDIDGEYWVAWLNNPLEPRSIPGTVRAYPDTGGRVKLVVDGTTENTELIIEPYARIRPRNQAHQFSAQVGRQDNLLHLSDIMVTSGRLNSILGYRTADLSGVVTIASDTPVSRIALSSINPGASIITGGDLNTLNVYNSAVFDGGAGLRVGRDLNQLTVSGDFEFRNGAQFTVGRDIGLTVQPTKGTSQGGVGGEITGNMYIGSTSAWTVGRAVDAPFVIKGRLDGTNHITIPSGGGNVLALGGYYPT
jgi:hypothetical protein